jgi:hypothetical protein
VSSKVSTSFSTAALNCGPGCGYGLTWPVISRHDDVESASGLMYTIFGESFGWKGKNIPDAAQHGQGLHETDGKLPGQGQTSFRQFGAQILENGGLMMWCKY